MKNPFLKLTLAAAKGLIYLKRGLVFVFGGLLGTLLAKCGYVIAHRLVFPLYNKVRQARRWYLQRFGSFNRTVLEFVSSAVSAILLVAPILIVMAGTESRSFASSDYLSGRHTLFSVYVGPGEEGELVDESSAEGNLVRKGTPPAAGIQVPMAPPGTDTDTGVESPDILAPGETALIPPQVMPGAVSSGPRHEIVAYVIEPGDTLGGIASKFNISLSTLVWENNLTARSVLAVGEHLRILPVSGVSHKVRKGDTLAKIAKRYSAKAGEIGSFNGIDDAHLAVGSVIIVPGGRKIVSAGTQLPSSGLAAPGTARGRYLGGMPPPSLRNVGQGMIWPTVVHYISQYFKLHHPGLDIAGPIGTPIYAADDGVVVFAGWNRGGYGNMILIDHQNGLMTRYGHSSQLFVTVGERVSKGQTISLMGSTGRSTGPHLHFEVIAGGIHVNPFLYVR